MRLTRRGLLLGAAALPFAISANVGSEDLTFLAMGDWGMEGDERQRDVAEQMGRTAAQRRCRFVVTLGDNFYQSGVSSTEDEQWQTSFEQIYTADSLQIPWYAILGNHDHLGDIEAQIAYSQKSPRWRMPARYYRQTAVTGDGASIDMFFLDTEEIAEEYVIHHLGDDEVENRRELAEAFAAIPQLGWLEGQLAASRADWKLVFGHHTILSGGDHGPTRELVMAVKPLLERYRVAAYFNGHDHDLQHIASDGLHYFCSGAGSWTREVQAVEGTRFFSDRPGFASIALNGRRLLVDFIDYKGTIRYRAAVARPS